MSPKKGAMSPKPPKSHDDRKSSHANEKTHMCKIPVHMLFGRPCWWCSPNNSWGLNPSVKCKVLNRENQMQNKKKLKKNLPNMYSTVQVES